MLDPAQQYYIYSEPPIDGIKFLVPAARESITANKFGGAGRAYCAIRKVTGGCYNVGAPIIELKVDRKVSFFTSSAVEFQTLSLSLSNALKSRVRK